MRLKANPSGDRVAMFLSSAFKVIVRAVRGMRLSDAGSAGVGAAISATGSGASGPGSEFIKPVAENGFGMCCRPAIGQHFLQMWILRMQAEKKFAHIGPRFNAMALRTGQDRAEYSRPRPGIFTAQEEPVLSADGLVPQRPLAQVVVDGQAAVVRVATQGFPLISGVGDRLCQTALGQHGPGQPGEEDADLVQHRDCLRSTELPTSVG
jgi:hypothetical protein